ncbi:hypothetical protein OH710_22700 [Pseudomonas capsici]|uniref:hypothetical protein n=1 Tax=Pseudomonas capsici TaxID=2810614 RepID=UPI0021F0C566|nr:hypothetical protein [Pseudomonas capsici]MCV4275459.1 hypothetical protein [Pseudomonas capsici]
MNDFLHAVANFLPTKIERVLWDGDSLIVLTKDWNFRTESVWRVSKNEQLLFACWDSDAYDLIANFSGQSILEVSWLIDGQPMDPCFKLSDGRMLNIFCSLSTEPWVMEFANGAVYLGNS